MINEIREIAIIGTGYMGRQIAAYIAFHGYNIHLFDANPEALTRAKQFVLKNIETYFIKNNIHRDPRDELTKFIFLDTISEVVKDVDLIIESVPERLELKKSIFFQIDKLAPIHAIIATTSSSFSVSKLEDVVERRDKLLNLHFYAPIPKRPMVDIMRGKLTSDETFKKGREWIESIKCVPLIAKKESPGFVFNRVWRAVKKEALNVWAGKYADFKDIDRGWIIFTGMKMGPFALMDAIGLDVVFDIEMAYFNESGDPNDKPPQQLKDMIDKGELGMKSGKGFYDWTEPFESRSPQFIKPNKVK